MMIWRPTSGPVLTKPCGVPLGTNICGARGNNFARFNYLGEWHSHPLFTVQASPQDHATMRGLAMDPKVGANFVVLLVFRLIGSRLEGSAHTYLPDGTIHPSQLELEGSE